MNSTAIFILSSLLFISSHLFAQSNDMTPMQKSEYLVKIISMEIDMDREKMGELRNMIYATAREEHEIYELFGDVRNDDITSQLEEINAKREREAKRILNEEEFEVYQDIVKNLDSKIEELNKTRKRK